MNPYPEFESIFKLPLAERLQLVEDLWDSIALDDKSVPVPESHIRELDRRFARHGSNPGTLLSLAELQQKITRRT